MTTPISNTTTPAQSTAPDVLDRIEAKIKARLPQDTASPPPASPQSQSGGLSTTDVPTMPPPPPMERGYVGLYHGHVLQADAGCDLDFLVGASGAPVPRESH